MMLAHPEKEQTASKGRAAMLKRRGYEAWRAHITGKRLPKVRISLQTVASHDNAHACVDELWTTSALN